MLHAHIAEVEVRIKLEGVQSLEQAQTLLKEEQSPSMKVEVRILAK